MSTRSLPNRIWYLFLQWMIYATGILVYQVRYWGRANIPKTGAVLVVCNHQSHFDPPMVGAGCTRRMNYLARKTLFHFPPLRWLIGTLDAIPIDRDGLGLNGIKESLRRLKRGEMVLIFPEGTRSRDGEIAAFRPGFTVLAARSRAWILPVAIEGAFAAWPRWRRLPGPGSVHVCFGKPIPPEEVAAHGERELAAEVERRVRECHAELKRHPLFR